MHSLHFRLRAVVLSLLRTILLRLRCSTSSVSRNSCCSILLFGWIMSTWHIWFLLIRPFLPFFASFPFYYFINNTLFFNLPFSIERCWVLFTVFVLLFSFSKTKPKMCNNGSAHTHSHTFTRTTKRCSKDDRKEKNLLKELNWIEFDGVLALAIRNTSMQTLLCAISKYYFCFFEGREREMVLVWCIRSTVWRLKSVYWTIGGRHDHDMGLAGKLYKDTF